MSEEKKHNITYVEPASYFPKHILEEVMGKDFANGKDDSAYFAENAPSAEDTPEGGEVRRQ